MSTELKAPPAHVWRGIIEEYRDRLPVTEATPVISLREGGTPLVYGQVLSEITGCDVWIKVEGANPTGSSVHRPVTHRPRPPPMRFAPEWSAQFSSQTEKSRWASLPKPSCMVPDSCRSMGTSTTA